MLGVSSRVWREHGQIGQMPHSADRDKRKGDLTATHRIAAQKPQKFAQSEVRY
ncbi:hypothetical protein M8C13_00430 [Crossiella sp. SN42]|uniref:hypothetical protein n=1 Tax=Crossiella sp. SN42 TaxID=2944808 RepID=UPI00207CB3FD|nr:hypothetical protein [Crossiella sp. SN42]MCO1574223.1 hypothetical protein [Crossiella sp. SN42]